MFCVVWLVWLRFVAFMGNYRAGEESGSARWGTLKEGKAFKDQTNEDNNLIFTQNYGLALHRPKYNPELDRNLNVLVIGGSGSGKTARRSTTSRPTSCSSTPTTSSPTPRARS